MGRAFVLAVLAVVLLAGCTANFRAAAVPEDLLSRHGWKPDASISDPAPRSEAPGHATQTLAYVDDGARGGYPASLSLTTIQTTLTLSLPDLRDRVRERIRERAAELGVRFDPAEEQGERTRAAGERTLYVLLQGKVESSGALFTARDATVRILGEVWTCGGASVVAVALAQVDSATRVGGVPVTRDPDDRNWRDIVQDPSGSIHGARGDAGLVHRARC